MNSDVASHAGSGRLERLTGLFAAEIDLHDPEEKVGSELWGTVAALVDHLGRNLLWAAELVRSGDPVDRRAIPRAPHTGLRAWFESCAAESVASLGGTDGRRPAWTPYPAFSTAGFWQRRIPFEVAKHLIDLRAAGGAELLPAPEVTPEEYAEVLDELFGVFLTDSRPTLERLPSTLVLRARDVDRSWVLSPDWHLLDRVPADATSVIAAAGDLALWAWERADARAPRFEIDGDPHAARVFQASRIHR